MTLQACAEIVQRGDPERFAAAMAAPVTARRVLFPLYAFNFEVARTPWVTEEPMIAEMRLQWWRDALEEIAEGRPVRKHEVTLPLAEAITPEIARELDRLIQARRWDIYKEAFEDEDHFAEYLTKTGGDLMWAAAAALGADRDLDPTLAHPREAIRLFGQASAFVRFMKAVPALEARGRIPLVDGRPAAISRRAADFRRTIGDEMVVLRRVIQQARPAILEGWQTAPLLRQIAQNPTRVADGSIGLSEFRKRIRLVRWAL
jgi:phytoene synthase